MKHAAMLSIAVVLSILPAAAGAQSRMPARMPLAHSNGFANSVVADLPDGDRVVAFSGQTAFDLDTRRIERGAVVIRISPRGSIRWTRELGHEDAVVRHLIPLSDGTLLMAGVRERGFISLWSGEGEEIWSLSPAGEFNYFHPALGPDGAIIVLGEFCRGTLSLPGAPDLNGRRQFNHYLAELDPHTGRARWAREITAGIEEGYLAIDVDGTLLVATHVRGRLGEADTVVNRYSRSGELMGVAYRRDRSEQNFPNGLRVMADGSVVLLSSLWRSEGGGYESRLIGLERDGTVRYERELPHWSELVDSAERTFVEVFAPITRTDRQRGMDRYVPGVRIVAFDLSGNPLDERALITTGADWVQSTVRVHRTNAGVWISGYESDGATHHERFFFPEESVQSPI